MRLPPILLAKVRRDRLFGNHNARAGQGIRLTPHEQAEGPCLVKGTALLPNLCRQQCDRVLPQAGLHGELRLAGAALEGLYQGLQWKHDDAVHDSAPYTALNAVLGHSQTERCKLKDKLLTVLSCG